MAAECGLKASTETLMDFDLKEEFAMVGASIPGIPAEKVGHWFIETIFPGLVAVRRLGPNRKALLAVIREGLHGSFLGDVAISEDLSRKRIIIRES